MQFIGAGVELFKVSTIMAKSKFSENLIKLKCTICKRNNYYTRKKKSLERKLEYQKYCKWCKKRTTHKQAKV
ncbi:MAG: 50S ribosomal protein L33 [Patescibacteria group bacterium]